MATDQHAFNYVVEGASDLISRSISERYHQFYHNNTQYSYTNEHTHMHKEFISTLPCTHYTTQNTHTLHTTNHIIHTLYTHTHTLHYNTLHYTTHLDLDLGKRPPKSDVLLPCGRISQKIIILSLIYGRL